MPSLEDRTLLLLVIAVSLAFGWILRPFFSAVLWATVLAIVFAPLYQRLLSSIGQHPSLAALSTVLIIVIAGDIASITDGDRRGAGSNQLLREDSIEGTGSRLVLSATPGCLARVGHQSSRSLWVDESRCGAREDIRHAKERQSVPRRSSPHYRARRGGLRAWPGGHALFVVLFVARWCRALQTYPGCNPSPARTGA